jgi:hypothetical protein
MSTIDENLVAIASEFTAWRDKFRSINGLYSRSAAIASQLLNRQVTEFEVATIELAKAQAESALAPTDGSYIRAAVLCAIAARYSDVKNRDHFGATATAEMLDDLEQLVSPQDIAAKFAPSNFEDVSDAPR